MMDKFIKIIITLIPSVVCFIFVQYFFDMGVVDPISIVVVPAIFALTLLVGIYTARKAEVGFLGHG